MTGLGDIARSQGNSDIALSHYGAALRANPNHGPAVLACADLKWSLGDQAGAVELYRRLSDGPPRVRDRVVEFEKRTAKAGLVSTAPSVPSASAAPQPTSETPIALPAASSEASKLNTATDVENRAPQAPVGPPPDIELK